MYGFEYIQNTNGKLQNGVKPETQKIMDLPFNDGTKVFQESFTTSLWDHYKSSTQEFILAAFCSEDESSESRDIKMHEEDQASEEEESNGKDEEEENTDEWQWE